MNCQTNLAYCSFQNARRLPTMVINYLKANCPNLWQLLYYEKNPYTSTLLTPTQITSMVCSKWDTNAVNNYYALPIRFSSQALSTKFAQFRVQLLAGESPNRTNGRVRFAMQFIVNDNAVLVNTPISGAEDRAFAMFQEVATILNGIDLPNIATAINIDESVDRNTGWRAVKFADGYSGYEAVWSCYIIS